MRTAQIGGDGVFRDANGFAVEQSRQSRPVQKVRPAQPSRPAPRLPLNSASKTAPRRSGGLFGLGQMTIPTSDPNLRRIAENPVVTADGKRQYGYPAPRPVSEFTLKPNSLTGDYKTELFSETFVYPISNVPAAEAQAANVDPTGVYMISVRSAPAGFIKLMKVVGRDGYWRDVPVGFFKKYFYVPSIDAQLDINSMFGTFNPFFEGTTTANPLRVSVAWARTMFNASYDLILDAAFSEFDVKSSERAAKASDLAGSVLTAFSTALEGLHAAGAGLDSRYIGLQSYLGFAVVGGDMLSRLRAIGVHLSNALATNNDAHYAALAAACTEFIKKGSIWGAVLVRSCIWTTMTILSLEEQRNLRWAATTEASNFLKAYTANEKLIAEKSGATPEQVAAFKEPFKAVGRTILSDEAVTDKALEGYFAESGMTQNDWIMGYQFFKDSLNANTRILRILKKPSSVVGTFDPDVYRGLGSLGKNGGPVRVPIHDSLRKSKALYDKDFKEGREKLTKMEPSERERWEKNLEIALKEAESLVKVDLSESAAAHDELLRQDPRLIEDPKALEDAADVLLRDPAKLLVGRQLRRVAERGPGSFIKAYATSNNRLVEISRRAPADPYRALNDFYDMFTVESEKYKVTEVNANVAAEHHARISWAVKMDPVTATEVFRNRLYKDYGTERGKAAEAGVLEHLETEVAELEQRIKVGEEYETGKFRPLTPDSIRGAQFKVDAFRRFARELKVARQGKKFELKRDAAYLRAEASNVEPARRNIAEAEQAALITVLGSQLTKAKNRYDDLMKDLDTLVAHKVFAEDANLAAQKKMLDDARSELRELKKVIDQYEGDPKNLDVRSRLIENYKFLNTELAKFAEAELRFSAIKDSLYTRISVENAKQSKIEWYKKWAWRTIGAGYRVGPLVRDEWLKGHTTLAKVWMTFNVSIVWSLWTVGLLTAGSMIIKALSYIPIVGKPFDKMSELSDLVYNSTLGKWLSSDPSAGPKSPLHVPDAAPGLGAWEILGLGIVVAAIVAPHKVVPGAIRLVKTVVGGISSIFGGSKGRGRPALGKKKAIGGGAPPDINKAIEEIKKGQKEGNPFLVQKGVQKLKRAKEMGLPVPKGYIDGLSWGL